MDCRRRMFGKGSPVLISCTGNSSLSFPLFPAEAMLLSWKDTALCDDASWDREDIFHRVSFGNEHIRRGSERILQGHEVECQERGIVLFFFPQCVFFYVLALPRELLSNPLERCTVGM